MNERNLIERISTVASNTVHNILDVAWKGGAIAAAIAYLGNDAPKGSSLNLARERILNAGHSVAAEVVRGERAKLE